MMVSPQDVEASDGLAYYEGAILVSFTGPYEAEPFDR